MSDTITLTWIEEDDNGNEIEFEEEFPSKMEVCSRCEGHGMHLHPDIGSHAYSMEEFNNEFDDEGKEEYFRRGGIYDVKCEECKGLRVVPVVAENLFNEKHKELYARYEEYERERARHDAEYESMCRMERMMGC